MHRHNDTSKAHTGEMNCKTYQAHDICQSVAVMVHSQHVGHVPLAIPLRRLWCAYGMFRNQSESDSAVSFLSNPSIACTKPGPLHHQTDFLGHADIRTAPAKTAPSP